ncbi:hypothetical protein M407DRAFT_17738 [Tulasnella calospora MUT 4182]|uniref:Uncharacterized protein n=1 Tax=Tulasnella calospora MUT 4182 TaxID=1051891 RepID=A0A0C3LHN6_9AGAM|nr:hypothetical protein M407DRAFT_17738 [Tulasnella calospora MUT 4182]
MHRPPSDEAESMFQAPGEPELDFLTQTVPEGVYDTLILAQSLMHIAASSSSLPTPESLSMAVAVFQAATKLQSPPVYEKDDRDDIIEKLQGRLESIEKASGSITELRASREETCRAFLALSAKIEDIGKGFEAQTVRFDTTAQAVEVEVCAVHRHATSINAKYWPDDKY